MTSFKAATQEIIGMLSYRRPAYSETCRDFCERYIAPTSAVEDSAGNWTLRVGSHSRVLWSCHTDTVHKRGGRQRIRTTNSGMLTIPSKQRRRGSNCLGADCTAGVWLMLEMIQAGVPGLYVFHAAEEEGGHGSNHIAARRPDLLRGVDFAIAFDRYGEQSIVTSQMGERCCSDAFAAELALMLGMGHRPDPTGVFTDTANYLYDVSECTNISVGFHNEHTALEALDMNYLVRLRDAVVDRFSEDALTAHRDPSEASFYYDYGSDELEDLVRRYPSAVARLLHQCGLDEDDVLKEINSNYLPML